MSNRLGTRIGLPLLEERAPDAIDVVLFEEPQVGALARTKGSLFLLAQVTGDDPASDVRNQSPSRRYCAARPRRDDTHIRPSPRAITA